MAFFKFRWRGRDEQPADKPTRRSRTPQTETVEVMRRRARHRLIGAAVLVLAGVLGFPLLFDSQPRPVAVDIPIEIPDRNKVAPMVVPAPTVQNTSTDGSKDASVKTQDSAASRSAPSRGSISGNGLAQGEELVQGPRSAASKTAVAAGAAPKVAAKTEVKPDPKVEPRPEPKAEPKPHPVPSPEPSTAARQDDAARAKALLEGRAAGLAVANAEEGRFIVQVGAFADNDKAREVRAKLERAGLKTYTQVVDTKDGKRTRVRVGPFANRAEADKAVARIKGLDLPASVLTL